MLSHQNEQNENIWFYIFIDRTLLAWRHFVHITAIGDNRANTKYFHEVGMRVKILPKSLLHQKYLKLVKIHLNIHSTLQREFWATENNLKSFWGVLIRNVRTKQHSRCFFHKCHLLVQKKSTTVVFSSHLFNYPHWLCWTPRLFFSRCRPCCCWSRPRCGCCRDWRQPKKKTVRIWEQCPNPDKLLVNLIPACQLNLDLDLFNFNNTCYKYWSKITHGFT